MDQEKGKDEPTETVIDLIPSKESLPDRLTQIIRYIQEHNGGYKIAHRADLKTNTMSTHTFSLAVANQTEDLPMVFIFGDNPIFQFMNDQQGPEWRTKSWICASFFEVNRKNGAFHDTTRQARDSLLTTASAQRRFGLASNNPFEIIGQLVSKSVGNFFTALIDPTPQEPMLYLINREAFEAVCDALYPKIAELQ